MFYSEILVQNGRYKGVKLFRNKDVRSKMLTPELGENLVRQAPRGMPEPRNRESYLVSMLLIEIAGPNGALPGVKTFLLQGCERSKPTTLQVRPEHFAEAFTINLTDSLPVRAATPSLTLTYR